MNDATSWCLFDNFHQKDMNVALYLERIILLMLLNYSYLTYKANEKWIFQCLERHIVFAIHKARLA